jgi:arylsulfatase A-like enzyme
MRHLYRCSIASMDAWLATVLERLDARGMLDDTIVLLTSDHGENLGEGNLLGHAFSLDQRLIHVPLVMAGPGVPSADELTGPTSLADLPRLLAGAIGLLEHPWGEPGSRSAVAVAQFDALAAPDDPWARESIERWGLGPASLDRLTRSLTAATDGRYKVVRSSSGTEEAFDLAADPLEAAPLDIETAGVRELAPWVDLRRALDAAVAERPTPAQRVDVRETQDIEDQMRLLGYL